MLRIALCAAALTALWSSPASAAKDSLYEEAEQERKDEARAMALKGYDFLQAGKYEQALRFFVEAEKIYHAPTIVLLLAQTHEKLGKLVEARAFYQKIIDEKLPKTAPWEFFEAQATARRELNVMAPRIATLHIHVPGASGHNVKVTIDGESVEALDQPQGVNPGKHAIAVTVDGSRTLTQSIDLKEGASERVVIPAAAVLGAGSGRALVPTAVAFGVGIVGVGIGTVTGLMARHQIGQVEDSCTISGCTARGEVSLAGQLSTISTISFVAGGIGLGTSAALLFFGGKGSSSSHTYVNAVMGPGSINVSGVF